MSSQARDLVARMICVDVNQRITFEEIQARCTHMTPSCAQCVVACAHELQRFRRSGALTVGARRLDQGVCQLVR